MTFHSVTTVTTRLLRRDEHSANVSFLITPVAFYFRVDLFVMSLSITHITNITIRLTTGYII